MYLPSLPHYYKLQPELNPQKAILYSKTYAAKIYVPVQLINKKKKQIIFSWVLLGNIPLMTKRGHFIVNGAARVVINQIIRGPGIYFNEKKVKNIRGLSKYYADIISMRGTWLRLSVDKKNLMWVEMKKTPKIPLLWLLLAMGWNERILFNSLKYPDRLLKTFDPLYNLTEKERENYFYIYSIPIAQIFTYSKAKFNKIDKSLIEKEKMLDTEHFLKSKVLQKLESNSKKWLFQKFMNPRTYDLSVHGRLCLNRKLGVKLSIEQRTLTAFDLLNATDNLITINYNKDKGLVFIDDIDHLKNRRIRTSSDLIQLQIGIGLIRLEKKIREQINLISSPTLLTDIINTKPLNGALREFFGTSPLCLTPDHFVLTTKGWIPIYLITLEHKVAVLSSDGTFYYDFPLFIHKYNYKGLMYYVSNSSINFFVTPNHRMYIHKSTERNNNAKNISFFKQFLQNKKNSLLFRENSSISSAGILSNNFITNNCTAVSIAKPLFSLNNSFKSTISSNSNSILQNKNNTIARLNQNIQKKLLVVLKSKNKLKFSLNTEKSLARTSFKNNFELIAAEKIAFLKTRYKKTAILKIRKDSNSDYQFILPSISINKTILENYSEKKLVMDSWIKVFSLWLKTGCIFSKSNSKFSLHKSCFSKQLSLCNKKLLLSYSPHSNKYKNFSYHFFKKQLDKTAQSRVVGLCKNREKVKSLKYSMFLDYKSSCGTTVIKYSYLFITKKRIFYYKRKSKFVMHFVAFHLKKLGWSCFFKKDRLIIQNQQLYLYLNNFLKSSITKKKVCKKFPDWIWLLSKKQCRNFLNTFLISQKFDNLILKTVTQKTLNTNNNNYTKDSLKMFSLNEELAGDLSKLALHAGLSLDIMKRTMFKTFLFKNKNSLKTLDFSAQKPEFNGQTNITAANFESEQNSGNRYFINLRLNNSKNLNYPFVNSSNATEDGFCHREGLVFCLSVPHQVFYVQRHGKTAWTGNSQFMDQINPLAEITHKRRYTSLGPSGISRDTATMAIRGIHPTHYGRICPVETPEGKNAGLVNTITNYARLNNFVTNIIYTPFYKVYKGIVLSKKFFYLSAEQEQEVVVCPADVGSSFLFFLPSLSIPVRKGDEFTYKKRNEINYQVVSPLSNISVATSLVPFLEHDDANRALMGANMQRQAVPLVRPDIPIVGTGQEAKTASDSGHVIQAKQSGIVCYSSAFKIILYKFI